MANITAPQKENIRLLIELGGIVKSSDWTNGHGRHITAKAIPPFAEKIAKNDADNYSIKVRKFFIANPRVKFAIAVTDVAGAKKAITSVKSVKAHSAVKILKDLENAPKNNPMKKSVVTKPVNDKHQLALATEIKMIIDALNSNKYTKARRSEIETYCKGLIMAGQIIGIFTGAEVSLFTTYLDDRKNAIGK